MRVAAHGKSFLLNGSPFNFRGVRYRWSPQSADPRGDGKRLGLDFTAMIAAGYTVVSLPPLPPSDIEQAAASGLRFLLELDDRDLNRVTAASRRERKRAVRDLAMHVRRTMRAWQDSHALLGIALGSRAAGVCSRAAPNIAHRIADQLAMALHDEDADLLAGWRAGWPLDVQCPAEFDFLLVDCELPSCKQLAPAIMSCHLEVGDRPLVLGSITLTGPERGLDPDKRWVIDTGLRCGVGGTMAGPESQQGMTHRHSETACINRRTVRDLDVDWPSISVVINAYNAGSTIDECLRHCDRLAYPRLEVIVVNDGSTDATPAIARSHPRVRLITIAHSGLSVGRNVGYRSARGELIAYLDADAYPSPEWPWYLALAAIGERVAGSGGPNVPPPDEPPAAQVVARSPGGPVPQLLGPDRAHHLPGCNMAFWRDVLERLDGFDPVLQGAADDIEFQRRVFDSGREIGYHPSALVWHHRRPGLAPYLRQQYHYGRSQAILERRHPGRFAASGVMGRALTRLHAQRNGGGAASYPVKCLTLPGDEGVWLELAHQWGMPAAIALCLPAPLAPLRRKLAAPAVAAAAFVGALFVLDVAVAGERRRRSERRLGFRASLAGFRLLRPLAFRWGHVNGQRELRAAPGWPPSQPAE